MTARVVSSSDIAAHPRQSLSPRDWIFSPGEKVLVDKQLDGVVAGQDENIVYVSRVEYVPGSSTMFACSIPEPVHLFRLTRRGRR